MSGLSPNLPRLQLQNVASAENLMHSTQPKADDRPLALERLLKALSNWFSKERFSSAKLLRVASWVRQLRLLKIRFVSFLLIEPRRKLLRLTAQRQ